MELPADGRRGIDAVSIHDHEFVGVDLRHLFCNRVPEVDHAVGERDVFEVAPRLAGKVPEHYLAAPGIIEGFTLGTGAKTQAAAVVRAKGNAEQAGVLA